MRGYDATTFDDDAVKLAYRTVGWCKLNSFDPWLERRLVSNWLNGGISYMLSNCPFKIRLVTLLHGVRNRGQRIGR